MPATDLAKAEDFYVTLNNAVEKAKIAKTVDYDKWMSEQDCVKKAQDMGI
jgi:ATP-dependent protease ClpP protease subunit